MQYCWMCHNEFPDDVRMVVPPGESSHICESCAQTEMGQRLMRRMDERYQGYRPGSFIKGDRFRQALLRWQRGPKRG